jgi:hypothetical protein
MEKLFVGGCNRALRLRSDIPGWFFVQEDWPNCETSLVGSSTNLREAQEACRKCPLGQAGIQPYLEPVLSAPALPIAPVFEIVHTQPAQLAEPPKVVAPVEVEMQSGESPFDDPLPPDAKPTLNECLKSVGIEGGPSLFGWSQISQFRQCLRKGFYSVVLGLKKAELTDADGSPIVPDKLSPLDVGTLVHACLEVHYNRVPFSKVLDAVKPHYPLLAAEALRLVGQYVDYYQAFDELNWDVRSTEIESRYVLPRKKIRGKSRAFMVSARTDLVVRDLNDGRIARLPPGEPASEVYLHDFKTAARVYGNMATSYRHDGQVLMNLLAFNRGFSVNPDGTLGKANGERLGPAKGLGIAIIGKAAKFNPNEHLKRFRIPVDDAMISEFEKSVTTFLQDEVFDRWLAPGCHDLSNWPKSYVCKDALTGTPCPFIELCELNRDSATLTETPNGFEKKDFSTDITKLEVLEKVKPKNPRGRKSKKSVSEVEAK